MEWNYYNTFITVSSDCPAERGLVPPDKKSGRTKPSIEYELVAAQPYGFTQEELLFEVFIRHKEITPELRSLREAELREEFFGKPKACMRASMLPKKYGWGIHFNAAGKMALVPLESEEYLRFTESEEEELKIVPAMRSKRVK